jgi:endonuclease/exonuclease/phosphatase family metal-dependent hydrolase
MSLSRSLLAAVAVPAIFLAFGCAEPEGLEESADETENVNDSEDVASDELSGGSLGPTRVLTYNVRRAGDTGDYVWSERKPHILEIIQNSKADLVGIQEAKGNMPHDIISGLRGYSMYPARHSPGERGVITASLGIAAPILYDSKRYTFTGGGTFAMPKGKGDCDQTKHGVWAQLQDKPSGKNLLVVNVHLMAFSECGAEREDGAKLVKKVITEKGAKRHVILVGDMNVDQVHPRAIKTRKEETVPMLRTNGRNLSLAADTTAPTDASTATFNPKWNNEEGSKFRRFDYIMFSSKLAASNYVVDRREVTLDANDKGRKSVDSPSDHYPVLATIKEK